MSEDDTRDVSNRDSALGYLVVLRDEINSAIASATGGDYNTSYKSVVEAITAYQRFGLTYLKTVRAAANSAANGSKPAGRLSPAELRAALQNVPPTLR